MTLRKELVDEMVVVAVLHRLQILNVLYWALEAAARVWKNRSGLQGLASI